MNKNLETALVSEICIICGQKQELIIMNSLLTERHANQVKNLHNKTVGFAEKPCSECKEDMEKAFIFIGYDESKSDMNNLPEGFYRTGHIVGVKKDIPLVQEFVKEHSPNAIEKGYIFFPYELMIQFKLITE